jgi:hypothetical protein
LVHFEGTGLFDIAPDCSSVALNPRADPHVQHAGQLRQREQTDIGLAPFQTGDRRPIRIRCRRKLFPTDALGAPGVAEPCADRAQQRDEIA